MRRCANHELSRPEHPLETLLDASLPNSSPLLLKLDDYIGFAGKSSDAYYNVTYCLFDADEGEKHNTWRKTFLARYGRQNMLQWDNVLVSDMNRLIGGLVEMVKQENELSRTIEDH